MLQAQIPYLKLNEKTQIDQTSSPQYNIAGKPNNVENRSIIETPEKLSKQFPEKKLYCNNCFTRLYPEKRVFHCKSDTTAERSSILLNIKKPDFASYKNAPQTSRESKCKAQVSQKPLTHRDKSDQKSHRNYIAQQIKYVGSNRSDDEKLFLHNALSDKKKSVDSNVKESLENAQEFPNVLKHKSYIAKQLIPRNSVLEEKKIQNYALLKKIGVGTFGKAFLVRDLSDPKFSLFVIKLINILSLGKKELSDAINEVKVLSVLKHPFIISYKESFIDQNRICIVMEYADCGDLFQTIVRKRKKNEYINERQILRWFTQITMALKYLHDNHILHRDLKSQNLFLTSTGKLCLGDFGIAKLMNKTCAFTRTQVGTPYFLSPEICQNKPYTWASDIWALGCVLYELITLKVPFQADSLSELILKITRHPLPVLPSHRVNPSLKQILYDCLNRDWRLRPTASKILEVDIIKNEASKIKAEYSLWEHTKSNNLSCKLPISYPKITKEKDSNGQKFIKCSVEKKPPETAKTVSPKHIISKSLSSASCNSFSNSKKLVEKCLKISTSMEKELKLYTDILDKCIKDSVDKIKAR